MHTHRQLVDPFIPAKPRSLSNARPAAEATKLQPVANPAPRQPRSAVSIDGIVTAPSTASQPLQPKPQHKPHLQPHPMLQRRPAAIATPVAGSVHSPVQSQAPTQNQPQITQHASSHPPRPQPALRKHWNLSKLALVGISLGVIFGCLSLFSLQLGQIVIGVYAVVAIWRRLPSRLTFLLALLMFGGIILSQLFVADSGISENLAVYAFLLLCVGTLSLAREVRQDSHHTPAGRH